MVKTNPWLVKATGSAIRRLKELGGAGNV